MPSSISKWLSSLSEDAKKDLLVTLCCVVAGIFTAGLLHSEKATAPRTADLTCHPMQSPLAESDRMLPMQPSQVADAAQTVL